MRSQTITQTWLDISTFSQKEFLPEMFFDCKCIDQCITFINPECRFERGSEVKKSICKRCHALLIPGNSSRVFVEGISISCQHLTIYKLAACIAFSCNQCGMTKRFNTKQRKIKSSILIDEPSLQRKEKGNSIPQTLSNTNSNLSECMVIAPSSNSTTTITTTSPSFDPWKILL